MSHPTALKATSSAGAFWEVVKEGPVSVTTIQRAGRSKLSQRWLLLARLRKSVEDTIVTCTPQELLLRTSKVTNNTQRKVQDYNLDGYQMITSAFSSSSCTLGPNVTFRFTVHCKETHSFATPDERTMLSWVAALKQVLAPVTPSEGQRFAVMYEQQEGRSQQSVGYTPQVIQQTPALLQLQASTMSLLHPLTESEMEEWPLPSLSHLKINSAKHTLTIVLCKHCRPHDGGTYLLHCTAGGRHPAKLLISLLHASVTATAQQSEFVCDLQHDCDYCYDALRSQGNASVPSTPRMSLCSMSSQSSQGSYLQRPALPLSYVTAQVQSMFDKEDGWQAHSEIVGKRVDPEGYMVMKPGELDIDRMPVHERTLGMHTLPTNFEPAGEIFRRTKSANFTARARVHHAQHERLCNSHSWSSDATSRPRPPGEPIYTEPTHTKAAHDASSVPPLKEYARRTTSGQSTCSGRSEHYASTVIVQPCTAATPVSCSSNSSNEYSGAISEVSQCTGSSDEGESGYEDYMTMAFSHSNASHARSNTIASSVKRQPHQDVPDGPRRHHTVHAFRTHSSPSNLQLHHNRPPLPDFKAFADAQRGYVTPDSQVTREPLSRNAMFGSQLPDSYVTFTCDGKVPAGSAGSALDAYPPKNLISGKVRRLSSLQASVEREPNLWERSQREHVYEDLDSVINMTPPPLPPKPASATSQDIDSSEPPPLPQKRNLS